MNTKDLTLSQIDIQKLMACGNPDAALLYLYIRCGNPVFEAASALHFSEHRYSQAVASLRQFGLWVEDRLPMEPARQSPAYTEEDVLRAMSGGSFPMLVDDVQGRLGRILTTEELKVILSFVNYLNLPPAVVSMMVCHCKERTRQRGTIRNPSLRTIEKEAYRWADLGINTIEEATAYMQADNLRRSRKAVLMRLLHINDRPLTAPEERYADSWIDMNFDNEALQMAYDKTCLNVGGLKWSYMNKILESWHAQGLHTGAQVRRGDKGPDRRQSQPQGQTVTSFEREMIARMIREQQGEE